eukprot:UC4_evm4s507
MLLAPTIRRSPMLSKKELTDTQGQARLELNRLREKLEAAERLAQNKELDRSRMAAKYSQVTTELAQFRSEEKKSKENLEQLADKLKHECNKCRKSNLELQKTCEKQKETIQKLQVKLRKHKATTDDLVALRGELQATKVELHRTKDGIEARVDKEVRATRQSLIDATAEYCGISLFEAETCVGFIPVSVHERIINERLVCLENKMFNHAKEEVEKEREKSKNVTNMLSIENERNRNNLHTMESELRIVRQENESINFISCKAKEKCETLQKALEQATIECCDLRKSKEKLEKHISEQSIKEEKLKKELQVAISQVTITMGKNQEMIESKSALRVKCDEMNQMESKMKEFLTSISDLKDEKSELKICLEESKKTVEKLRREIPIQVCKAVSREKVFKEDIKKNFKDCITNFVNSVRNELQYMKKEMYNIQQYMTIEHHKMSSALTSRIWKFSSASVSNAKHFEDMIKDEVDSKLELEREHSELLRMHLEYVNETTDIVREKDVKIMDMQNSFESMEKKYINLYEKKEDNFEKKLMELVAEKEQEWRGKMSSLYNDRDRTVKEMNDREKRLLEEINSYRQNEVDFSRKIMVLEDKIIETLKSKESELEDAVKSSLNEKAALIKEMENQHLQLASVNENLMLKLETLEKRYNEKIDDFNNLKSSLSNIFSICSNFSDAISDGTAVLPLSSFNEEASLESKLKILQELVISSHMASMKARQELTKLRSEVHDKSNSGKLKSLSDQCNHLKEKLNQVQDSELVLKGLIREILDSLVEGPRRLRENDPLIKSKDEMQRNEKCAEISMLKREFQCALLEIKALKQLNEGNAKQNEKDGDSRVREINGNECEIEDHERIYSKKGNEIVQSKNSAQIGLEEQEKAKFLEEKAIFMEQTEKINEKLHKGQLEIRDLEGECLRLQHDLKIANDKLGEAEGKIAESINLEKQYREKIHELESEINCAGVKELTLKLEEQKTKFLEEKAIFMEQTEKINEKLHKGQLEIRDLEGECLRLQHDLKIANDKLGEAEGKIAESINLEKQYREKIHELESEINCAGVKELTLKLEEQKTKFLEEKAIFMEQTEKINEKLHKGQLEIRDLEGECLRLQHDLKIANDKLGEAEGKIAESINSEKQYREKIHELESEINSARVEKKMLEEKTSNSQTNLDKQLQLTLQLRKKLSLKNEQVEAAHEVANKLRSELASCREAMLSYRRSKEKLSTSIMQSSLADLSHHHVDERSDLGSSIKAYFDQRKDVSHNLEPPTLQSTPYAMPRFHTPKPKSRLRFSETVALPKEDTKDKTDDKQKSDSDVDFEPCVQEENSLKKNVDFDSEEFANAWAQGSDQSLCL